MINSAFTEEPAAVKSSIDDENYDLLDELDTESDNTASVPEESVEETFEEVTEEITDEEEVVPEIQYEDAPEIQSEIEAEPESAYEINEYNVEEDDSVNTIQDLETKEIDNEIPDDYGFDAETALEVQDINEEAVTEEFEPVEDLNLVTNDELLDTEENESFIDDLSPADTEEDDIGMPADDLLVNDITASDDSIDIDSALETDENILIDDAAETDELNFDDNSSFDILEGAEDENLLEMTDSESLEEQSAADIQVDNGGIFDYSVFDYEPEQENQEDYSSVISDDDINSLNDEFPELNILKVFDLRFNQNMTVNQIKNELGMSKEDVAKALRELLSLV